ncbi:MAG: type II toxin-antitoxin system VapC family toxin [Giesbergeria sp.]
MIGIDTNVLVRYIMQDEPKQSAKAGELIESLDNAQPGYVALVSMVELYWVLTSCYELTNAQLLQLFEGLLRTSQLVVERAEQVAQALRVFAAGKADFADCLIERSAAAAGCEQTMTFDVKASKHARMTLIV